MPSLPGTPVEQREDGIRCGSCCSPTQSLPTVMILKENVMQSALKSSKIISHRVVRAKRNLRAQWVQPCCFSEKETEAPAHTMRMKQS